MSLHSATNSVHCPFMTTIVTRGTWNRLDINCVYTMYLQTSMYIM